jgi:hypothetical protein
MPIAKGVAKVVAYKKETTFGTLAGAIGARQLRRVTSAFNLMKETYESGEIRTDRQIADFRHGVRSAEGSLNGELSSNTYSDFMGSLLARDFAAVASLTGLSITITGTGPTYTVSRAAGNWVGTLFVGQVVRLTAGTFNVANLNKNILIIGMTASDLTVVPLNGSALVAEGPIAAATVAVPGKHTFVPATGHTDQSYTVEEWYQDIAQSETYTGMKVGSMNVQLPSTGMATVDLSFQGSNLTRVGTTQYFTSPAAQGVDGLYTAVNGVVVVDGVPVAVITSADFSIERALENATVVGSNSVAEIFTGRIRATGNLSVYFQDAAMRDKFDLETSASLVFTFTEDNTAGADFISFALPKVKFGSFTKDDGELGLIASTSFQALLNEATAGGLIASTIAIQDSNAA